MKLLIWWTIFLLTLGTVYATGFGNSLDTGLKEVWTMNDNAANRFVNNSLNLSRPLVSKGQNTNGVSGTGHNTLSVSSLFVK